MTACSPQLGCPKLKNILVVEDEQDIRDSLQEALEFEGYNTLAACNGQEALSILRILSSPCLILLDLMMPIMNGWQFMEAINGDHVLATIPIVVVSAFGDKERTIQAQGFVKKPIDLDTLLNTVKQYCG